MSKLLLLLLPLLVVACNPNESYNAYQPVGKEGWHRDSMLTFSVPVSDTLSTCRVELQIRHTGSYPYDNLWVAVEMASPDSSNSLVDTLEVKLVDKNNNWIGAGSGHILHLTHLLRSDYRFNRSGTYTFTIRHCMDDTLLKELSHAGLRIAYQNGKE